MEPVGRQTGATRGGVSMSYQYDGVGNRMAFHLSASYAYQPFNKLTSTATGTYTYDNNGNLLSKTDSLGTTTFTWNEENQLTQISLPGGLTVNYKYDGLGRRIQRTTSAGASERYVYDGQDVLLDLNADWSVATTYLNGPGLDNHLRQTNSITGVSYFLTDHLGTTAALTDATGNIVEQLSYDSFGNSTGSARSRYGYTGRERDPDTGQLHYRARFYDPQLGRFLSEDPIGFGGGDVNFYAYVKNRSMSFVDPQGTNPLAIAAFGGLIIGEAWLHSYLGNRASGFYPDDPHGRKKHCYVNCMSTRIHGFNPVWPTLASVEQEAVGVPFVLMQGSRNEIKESMGDLAADLHGQTAAAVFWRSCQRLCESCPF